MNSANALMTIRHICVCVCVPLSMDFCADLHLHFSFFRLFILLLCCHSALCVCVCMCLVHNSYFRNNNDNLFESVVEGYNRHFVYERGYVSIIVVDAFYAI